VTIFGTLAFFGGPKNVARGLSNRPPRQTLPASH
jgi:hypothetical protein